MSNNVLCIIITLFVHYLLFTSCYGQAPRLNFKNSENQKFSKKLDSITHRVNDSFFYSLYILEDKSYWLEINCKGAIRLNPFFWDERKAENGIFTQNGECPFVNIDSIIFISIPLGEASFTGYFFLQNENGFEFCDGLTLIGESGFIYDIENNYVVVPIVRGHNSGNALFYNFNRKNCEIELIESKNYSEIENFSAKDKETINAICIKK